MMRYRTIENGMTTDKVHNNAKEVPSVKHNRIGREGTLGAAGSGWERLHGAQAASKSSLCRTVSIDMI